MVYWPHWTVLHPKPPELRPETPPPQPLRKWDLLVTSGDHHWISNGGFWNIYGWRKQKVCILLECSLVIFCRCAIMLHSYFFVNTIPKNVTKAERPVWVSRPHFFSYLKWCEGCWKTQSPCMFVKIRNLDSCYYHFKGKRRRKNKDQRKNKKWIKGFIHFNSVWMGLSCVNWIASETGP